jgi:hypothetical protein
VRLFVLFAVAVGAAAVAACYDQPAIPRDRPLSCVATVTPPCPAGFSCIGGVCAPRSCRGAEDCPAGLVCLGRNGGCGLAHVDGGGVQQDGGPDGSLLENVVGADR